MPVQMYAVSPQVDTQNFAHPDGQKIIWPNPHDAKADVYWCVKQGLRLLELTDVPVHEDGIFLESQLTNKKGESVPVITIMRMSDITVRNSLGDMMAQRVGGATGLIDPCNTVPDGQEVDFFGEWSRVGIDVVISDLDGARANQMYLIVKYIMLAAQKDLREAGYLDIKRTNGVDQTQVVPDSPAIGHIFTRTLSYEMVHPDFIATLPTLVQLVRQTLTIPTLDSPPDPIITAAL